MEKEQRALRAPTEKQHTLILENRQHAALTGISEVLAFDENQVVLLTDGGFIAPGYDAELDDLRATAADGHRKLAEFQAKEQARTGIAKLKVKHVPAFGFLIEIPKASVALAPADYIRRQTLTTGERFVTPELKEFERQVLGARRERGQG